MGQGVVGSNPARFNFLINFFCFKSEGWWLFNKMLQLIVISLSQDSLLSVCLCTYITNKTGVQVDRAGIHVLEGTGSNPALSRFSYFSFSLPKYQNFPQLTPESVF